MEKVKSTFRSLCDVQPMETERDLETENNIIRLQQQAEQAGKASLDPTQTGRLMPPRWRSLMVMVTVPLSKSTNPKRFSQC